MPQFAFYVPTDANDLARAAQSAEPIVKSVELIFQSLPCPNCDRPTPKRCLTHRYIYDYGDEQRCRPIQIHLQFSRHYCSKCKKHFAPDAGDIAPRKSRYTHRVIRHAIRLVVEDQLSYRVASWNLWRDHLVFVPHATIQNWVEAAGKKS